MIGSVLRTGKNYYPRVFLEECKYVGKEKKIPKYIIDDIEISSGSDEENSDKKIPKKKSTKKCSDEENSSEINFDEENSCEESVFYILKK